MQGTEIFFVTLQPTIVSVAQWSHYFYLQLTAFLNPTQESLLKTRANKQTIIMVHVNGEIIIA